MGKSCQIIMGPAGTGKSTYCQTMMQHCETIGRPVHLVNLDPAAENFEYQPTIDVRELITLEDVMEELGLGPNGGLIYCMEFLVNNIDWLDEELAEYGDDYLIVDCPGQIEIYTHFPIMKQVIGALTRLGYNVCGVYIIDSQFIDDPSKFFSGVLSAMAAMLQLEIPHVNVLSKMDLLGARANSEEIDHFLDPDPSVLLDNAQSRSRPQFHRLNEAVVRLVEEFNMVAFMPLNIKDEDSIEKVLYQIDHAIQFYDDEEVKETDFGDEGEAMPDESE